MDNAHKPSNIPIHFLTIVLNGEPFIRYHIEAFKQLPFKWHWHIVEGVANKQHDTIRSVKLDGQISNELHRNGLSNDGTTEYLNNLKNEFPKNITLYRKPNNNFWAGKLEMVNAPIEMINEKCLLWLIDADELWTKNQFIASRKMFIENPTKHVAYYFCHYFIGETLMIATCNGYGNNTKNEWIRTWRFQPGMQFLTHEPPRLCRKLPNGEWKDILRNAWFTHKETEARQLVFQHYAYTTEKQVRFKELYYGYNNAVNQWKSLQQAQKFPILIKNYLAWVTDYALVDQISLLGIIPIAKKDKTGNWIFTINTEETERASNHIYSDPLRINRILWIRTDSIEYNLLSASMLPYIKNHYKNAKITVLCQTHLKEIYETCPFVDAIITFDKQKALHNKTYQEYVIQQLSALNIDLSLNSLNSRDQLADIFTVFSTAIEKVAHFGDYHQFTSNKNLSKYNQFYTSLIPHIREHLPTITRNNDFLQGLGIKVHSLQPQIWVNSEDIKFANQLLSAHNIQAKKAIALFAGAQSNYKHYSHYGVALSPIIKDRNLSVIAFGEEKDFAINQENLDKIGAHTLNLSGKITLRQTAALLQLCRLAVGAESWIAHMACAAGTPNVILLGGGQFGQFMPYSALTSIVCLPLVCFGCNWHCKYQNIHCVKDIKPEIISEAIRQTMEKRINKPHVFIQSNAYLDQQPELQSKWKKLNKILNFNKFKIIPLGDFSATRSEHKDCMN